MQPVVLGAAMACRSRNIFLIAFAVACFSSAVLGAIHPYNNEYFYAVGDAYIFRGGREGMFASTKEVRPCFTPASWHFPFLWEQVF